MAGHLRPLPADIGSSPLCHHVWPDKYGSERMITHQSSPAHNTDHLDGIYRSVVALIDSIEERDSNTAVALHDEDECPDCFRQAILHVIELLPHCGTTAHTADLARQWHMECLQGGRSSRSATTDLVNR